MLPNDKDSTALNNFLQQSFYWNLSCPVEWSKYSCIHHGHQKLAETSLRYALQYDNHALWKALSSDAVANLAAATSSTTSTPKGKKTSTPTFLTQRVVLIGDSLIRQLFIALTCRYSQHIQQQRLPWPTEKSSQWPCHNTPNCIKTGQHSGFHYASIQWKQGGELHVYPLQLVSDNTAAAYSDISTNPTTTPPRNSKPPLDAIQTLSAMTDCAGIVTPQGNPTRNPSFTVLSSDWQHVAGISYLPFPNSSLNPKTLHVLIVNPGVHYNLGTPSSHYEIHRHVIGRLSQYGEILLSRRKQQVKEFARIKSNTTSQSLLLPRLVYMTTPTQHFDEFPDPYKPNKKRNKQQDGVFRPPLPVPQIPSTKPTKPVLPDPPQKCLKLIDIDPRREIERELLQSGKHIDSILDAIDMKELGDLHIGRGDCTHYCMPGIPDISAHRLVLTINKWNN